MKRKYWWVFGSLQLLGLLAGAAALYVLQDPIFLGGSLLLLLPGTLFSFSLSTLGHTGTRWPIWTMYPIAVVVNALFFAIVALLAARFRKSGRDTRARRSLPGLARDRRI
jgi:NADH:ubiquinone oxidoreductase subunit 6 (subunit J)